MHYKTILLELLQQHPALHHQLRTNGTLLQAVDQFATALKARHGFWIDQLSQAKPQSEPSQISSEALELALQELQGYLPPPSPPSEATTEPLSLDAAMAFLRRHTPLE